MAGGIVKHGHGKRGQQSRTYLIWKQMRKRCANPNTKDWPYYGGRGIKVCARWNDYLFFLADMGEAPPGLSIDREDNDVDYEPGNCRWATAIEQQRNSANVHFFTLDGVTRTSREWELSLGLSQGALWHRLKGGWSIERALTTKRKTKS